MKDKEQLEKVLQLIESEDESLYFTGLILACGQGYDFFCDLISLSESRNRYSNSTFLLGTYGFNSLNKNFNAILFKFSKDKIKILFKDFFLRTDSISSRLYTINLKGDLKLNKPRFKSYEIINKNKTKGRRKIKEIEKTQENYKKEKIEFLVNYINYYYRNYQKV